MCVINLSVSVGFPEQWDAVGFLFSPYFWQSFLVACDKVWVYLEEAWLPCQLSLCELMTVKHSVS